MNHISKIFEIVLFNALTYKKGTLFIFAIPFSLIIDFIYNGSFLGIGILYIILFGGLIVADFTTGIIASRHLKQEISSTKMSYTFWKILFYVLFFFIMYNLKKDLEKQDYWIYDHVKDLINIFSLTIFTILVLREYVSIGENIHKTFGKKPEIFTLVDRIANTIEDNLIRKISESDLFNKKDKEDEDKPTRN
jgi:hypothetical protein